jgi:hypothetical protein
MKNTLKILWNEGNPVETGFLEERGWISLEIAKQGGWNPKWPRGEP